ncbi:sensor histidine kinase [Rhodococcus yananensis]|uniref:sensor histidine kinase n=1 Tax=Rhodococcus yananensis TaxID=2879464 RepID=UPI001CF8AFD4|nr:HAMP domain-containing sensor histidine kinase [Rhodococcus yananensis]
MARLRALPLRLTLVATLVLFAGVGLLVSGLAVTSALESSLQGRVDRDLHDASRTWAKPLGIRPPPSVDHVRPPSPYFVQVTGPDGDVLLQINDHSSRPDLADVAPGEPTTVGSTGDGDTDTDWRVLTTEDSFGGTTTVAMTLRENEETVSRLVALEAGIGGIVLVVLAIAAYFVVRRSLRPLGQVERTAVAIAGGDLHERVPESSPHTEVGRLAVALNTMLEQIQTAFATTAASEESARRSEESARRSEESAKRSEEKMRRFVADASHELRTPLTTIRGFAELYRQGASDDTDLLMDRIFHESRRMGVLVEDLLMLARLDAQRPLENKPVDLLAIAADAVHGARVVAPDRTIRLEVVDGPGTPEVMGDDVRLRQVLGNLVTNALTHTPPEASVTVRVGTDGDDAVLEVADTGPGLSGGDRERVFERFYRTDSSRTRSVAGSGSGLGLSIVAALVAAHGGSVVVDGAPGVGATFRVRLPRVRRE